MLARNLTAFLFALLFSGAALAESVVSPGGGGPWNFYAMGNGEAIASILGAIKLMMSPDEGNSGYGTVLLFMAIVGFVVLAAQAGFNPGKHLGRMFGYVLVVWMIMLTTTSIKANVRVYDPVTNYDTVVSRVPALVAVPAALVSEIGVWMTRKMEDVFTVPSELTLSAGASEGLGGGYNLFGRMMADADSYTITNPDLKRSLAAYAADCVVPAIARGKLSVQKDLLQSNDMMQSLSHAQHPSIMTTYSVRNGATPSCSAKAEEAGALGAVMSCSEAYACIALDMEKSAEELLTAGSKSWGTTGVMVPYETAMASALQVAAGGGGANAYANYARPQGFILQKSLMSSMRGSFRQAAVQTGNNELLMAASISQAEQAQKSGWWTAAEVFKNLMGYIYTVLQAFLFAIVPVIIIALMIPGLGAKIFVNYSQLLIWLALWMPLLAIINYLITLFGKQDLYSVWSLSGGPTMQTEWTVSEKTNNLVVAAQFLGTSVPILALGLVKGAMAFTEFVSHGIGSSLATQAGASASSGNMSMGNMSMDNVSANKYNTAMSSSVGSQDVMAYMNGGTAQQTFGMGGTAATANGGSVTQSLSEQRAQLEALAAQQVVAAGTTAANGVNGAHTQGATESTGAGTDARRDSSVKETHNSNSGATLTESGGTGATSGESAKLGATAAATQGATADVRAGAGINPGAGGGGGSGGGSGGGGNPLGIKGTGVNGSLDNTRGNNYMASGAEERTAGTKAGYDSTGALTQQSGHGAETGVGYTEGAKTSHDIGTSNGSTVGTSGTLGTSGTRTDSFTGTESNTTTNTQNTSMNAPMSWGGFQGLLGNPGQLGPRGDAAERLLAAQDRLEARVAVEEETAARFIATQQGNVEATRDRVDAAGDAVNSDGIMRPVDHTATAQARVNGARDRVEGDLKEVKTDYSMFTAAVMKSTGSLDPTDQVTGEMRGGRMVVGDDTRADWVAAGVAGANLYGAVNNVVDSFGKVRGGSPGGGSPDGISLGSVSRTLGTSVGALGAGTVVAGVTVAAGTGYVIGSGLNYLIEGTSTADWIGEKTAQAAAFLGSDEARQALETNRRLEALEGGRR